MLLVFIIISKNVDVDVDVKEEGKPSYRSLLSR